MGIQVYIKTADIKSAGGAVEVVTSSSYELSPCESYFEEVSRKYCVIVFPTGERFGVDLLGDEVYTDFNTWGGTRPRLEPLLKALKIPYREC